MDNIYIFQAVDVALTPASLFYSTGFQVETTYHISSELE